MELRRAYAISGTLAVNLPKRFLKVIGITKGDYIELFMPDPSTIVLRKHKTSERKRSDG